MVAERETQSSTPQSERPQEVEPAEALEPGAVLVERLFAPPMPPAPPAGDPFTMPVHSTGAALRQRRILQAQRVHGNAFVQRRLGPAAERHRNSVTPLVQRAVIQRQGGSAKAVKIPLGEKEFDVDAGLAGTPFKLDKVKVGGEAEVSATPPGAGNSKVTMSHESLGGEVGTEWDKISTRFGDITVSSKAEAEITKEGGSLSVGLLGVKFKDVSLGVKFSLIDIDTDNAEINIGTTTLSAEYAPIAGDKTMPDGTKLAYEIKGTAGLVFAVDKAKVAKWLAEKFGEDAAIELGLAGGFAAAGIATLAAAYFQAVQGKELAAAVDEARRLVNEFCAAYAGTLDGTGDWTSSTQWGYKGEAAANAFIKGKSKDAIRAEAKKKGNFALRSQAFGAGWPKVKEAAYASWKENHSVADFVYGDNAPGLKTLKFILEDPRQNRYTEETYSEY